MGDIPPFATDCHIHVFGDPAQYLPAPARVYTPVAATLPEWRAMMEPLGFRRVVLVQPSAYGTDNRCMLDGLREAGGAARGIAVIDAATPEDELRVLHATGVRGIRLNLTTGMSPDPAAVPGHAARCRGADCAAGVAPAAAGEGRLGRQPRRGHPRARRAGGVRPHGRDAVGPRAWAARAGGAAAPAARGPVLDEDFRGRLRRFPPRSAGGGAGDHAGDGRGQSRSAGVGLGLAAYRPDPRWPARRR